jgi:hypothetical protein
VKLPPNRCLLSVVMSLPFNGWLLFIPK